MSKYNDLEGYKHLVKGLCYQHAGRIERQILPACEDEMERMAAMAWEDGEEPEVVVDQILLEVSQAIAAS